MGIISSIGRFFYKHDTAIFAISEIALATGAVVCAVKNTEKYIEDHEDYTYVDDPTPEMAKNKAKDMVVHYWPTMVLLGGFIGIRTWDCIHTQNVRKEYAKALMACQTALAAARKKNLTTQNPKAITKQDGDQLQGDDMVEARNNNTYDQYGYEFFFDDSEMPEPEESVYLTNMCKRDAFYIPITGRYFISTLVDVQQAEINCRLQLESGKDVYLNDLYKFLGIGSDGIGHDLYMEGDPSEDGDSSGFSFDLAPAMVHYNDNYDSSDLIYTINPTRFIYDINVPR